MQNKGEDARTPQRVNFRKVERGKFGLAERFDRLTALSEVEG